MHMFPLTVARFPKFSKSLFNYPLINSSTMGISGATIKTVFIDLSGTLHIENCAIEGSVDALKRLRKANLKIKFVTNSSRESGRFLFERLKSLGFEVHQDEIFSSLHATKDFLVKEKLKPFLMIERAAWEDFIEYSEIPDNEINAVVIGYAPSEFNYDQLNDAFKFIMGGARLIAIHEGRYFMQKDGLVLGPGPFVKGLEFATDAKATVVGKPTSTFFKAALAGDNPETAVMIGDDVRDDVEGALKVGMKGILVKTGKYLPGDEKKISPPPTEVCDNFSQAVDKIIGTA